MEWIWRVRRHWWSLLRVLISWFWITIPFLGLGIKDVRERQIILKIATILEHPSNMLSEKKMKMDFTIRSSKSRCVRP